MAGTAPLLMETIFHRWQTGSAQERLTCHAVFTEMLIGLLWRKRVGQKVPDRTNRLAHQVKELLDRSPGSNVAIQPLLATLGFSYEHLNRIFKKTFGITPVRYRNAARLERARHLLRDPRRTVAEAAYAAGFDDPAYFSRKFRELHGVAPSQARN